MQKELEQQRWRIFMIVSAGVFMATMDSSMLNVALPEIMKDFQSSLALTEWIVLIYLLTITGLLLFWGNLSDRICRGKIYSTGMLIFTFGSFFCAAAPEVHSLIFFRFTQALGASMMMACGPALIKSSFPASQIGRGLGLIGVATSLGLMSGPVISGILIRWVHWRFIFLVTVPVGLLFFLLGRRPLTQLCSQQHSHQKPKKDTIPFDTKGTVLWILSVTITLLLATHATVIGDGKGIMQSLVFQTGLILALVCWALLLIQEKRYKAPLLPLALFKKRFFLMAILSAHLSFAVLFSVLILIPFYLDKILHLSSDKIGYVMMAVPACVFIVSPIAGKIHDRTGAKVIATCGLFCCFLSLFFLTNLSVDSSPISVAVRLALLGFGQAMFLSPNSAAALSGVPHRKAGVTASLLATSRNFGMLLGTVFTGLIFTLYFSSFTGGLDMKDFTPEMASDFMMAMKRTFQYWMILALGGVFASWFRGGMVRADRD